MNNDAVYLFEGRRDNIDGLYMVDVHVHHPQCDKHFDYIANILYPMSDNPILRLNVELGFNGVQKILDGWNKHKAFVTP